MALRPNFNSIATRLILIGIAFIVLGGIGRAFLLSNYLRNDITELSSAQLLTLANYVAKDIDHDIVERRESLARLAGKFPVDLLQDPKQLQSWLAERYEINPLFSQGLAVLDLSGVALADYPALPERVGMSFTDRDYFRQALLGEFAIGRPIIGQVSSLPVLPMAIPLRDAAGKVRAVLAGVSALHSPNFMEALYATRIGTAGALVLVSPRDKLLVTASDSSVELAPVPQEGKHPQYDKAMKGFRGVGLDTNAQGIEELAAVASVPSSGWFVVARLPASEAFAPIDRLRGFILLNTTILAVFFSVLLAFVMRWQLRPLVNAAGHADRMTLGETPFEPLPVARTDEVGHLTTAFNRLLAKLLESRAELQHIAHHDTLTGLPNRQLLADRMKQALARAQRTQRSVAVLFLDLDGFKLINDRSGHEAGDAALREVADRLNKVVRREDTLARVGGDEFVILLSDLNENARTSAEMVARKCLEIFQQPFIINDQSCRLGTSIGIAIGDDKRSPDKLLIAADEAMYRAKEAGRGLFRWADVS